jgi:hypothetical protein
MRVRTANDLLPWVRFFLVAVGEIPVKGRETFRRILDLKEDVEQKRIGD